MAERPFRDPRLAEGLLTKIHDISRKQATFMEFCGGHTHAILREGLRQLLPPHIQMRSGPGCPVCVTDAYDLDLAIALARIPNAILTTFGDMIKVPGSVESLDEAKADGADVRIVYSTLDALDLARRNPHRAVVFLGVGFETTAPTVAASILQARDEGIGNYRIVSLHKRTPPAIRAVLEAGEVRLSGVVGPGHVTTIIGSEAWEFLPREHGVPCAVAGFELTDILGAILALVQMVEAVQPDVINAYPRSVQEQGNPAALAIMNQVFRTGPARWRGLGLLPDSGLHLREKYSPFDALREFDVDVPPVREPSGCRCGDVLRGVLEPLQCPLFGESCTPETPVGPCMVSAEGGCAAHYRYRMEEA
jgi:hydrogenase expression/formation protein HypD